MNSFQAGVMSVKDQGMECTRCHATEVRKLPEDGICQYTCVECGQKYMLEVKLVAVLHEDPETAKAIEEVFYPETPS